MSIFKKIRNKDSKVYKVRLINKKTEAVTDKEVLFNNKNGHVFITQESAVLKEDFVSSGQSEAVQASEETEA